ncbi:MAG: sigma-E factor negative regulatory protein [Rhodoferax sp.]|nr:sigma-E factor negative regulatory protein [Rhodoferax sp.]MCF8209663.1 sigma-E factor negative regulatory protein [Rhodoferax sp.]
MTSHPAPNNELLSALVDGQLRGDDLRATLECLVDDPQGRQTWHTYHVVGDVLRSGNMAAADRDFAFLTKLEQRLVQEPARPTVASAEQLAAPPVPASRRVSESANAAVWRWKWLAGVACTALLAVIGVRQWNTVTPHAVPQLAALAPPAPVTATGPEDDRQTAQMIRDPALDSLLAAHHQLGGHSALQRPSGFLRNATFEGPQR